MQSNELQGIKLAAWLSVLSAFIIVIVALPAAAANVTAQPSGSGTAWTWTWPINAGTNTYVLSTDGTGITSWVSPSAGTSALSALTAATTGNNINNAAYAQTWTWNSLTTGTGFTLSTSSLTSGNLLSLQNTAVALTSTGKVLNISDTTTGSGYGLYSAMTGVGDTGYAGYFATTSATGASYAVVGSSASATGYGGYFANSTSGWALGATGTTYFNGSVGIGTPQPSAQLQINWVVGTTSPLNITNSAGISIDSFDTYGNLKIGPINTSNVAAVAYDGNVGNFAFTDTANTYITCGYNNSASCTIDIVTAGGGFVGIGTTTPEATLDINGYMRLTPESAQPVACSSTNNGALTLTAIYTLCACKGSSSTWVTTSNGTTTCTF